MMYFKSPHVQVLLCLDIGYPNYITPITIYKGDFNMGDFNQHQLSLSHWASPCPWPCTQDRSHVSLHPFGKSSFRSRGIIPEVCAVLTLTEPAGITVQQAACENMPGAVHTQKQSCPLLLCSLKNTLKPKSFLRGCSKRPAVLLQAFHWELLSSSQPGLDLQHCRGSAQKRD